MPSTTRGAVAPGPLQSAAGPGFSVTDALLLLMALIWGVNFSVVKFGAQQMDPLAFTGIRVAISAATLGIMARFTTRDPVSRRDLWRLMGLGVIGHGAYQLLFVEGISRTRAGDAALVIASSPAFIAIISRLRGVDSSSRRAIAGIVLSVSGVGIVVLGSRHAAGGSSSLPGTLLVLGGAVCWSLYSVLLTPLTRRVDGLTLSAWTLLGGSIPLLVVSSGAMVHTNWAALRTSAWLALAYASFGAMVFGYLLWYRGVRVLGPTRTAMYSNLQPVIALVVAWVTLGEAPTAWQLAGGGSVMAGLFLARRG